MGRHESRICRRTLEFDNDLSEHINLRALCYFIDWSFGMASTWRWAIIMGTAQHYKQTNEYHIYSNQI